MTRESRHRYAYCDDPVEDDRGRKRTWSNSLALAASLVVGTIFLGSTYAANVNLSGSAGSSVEFGQGFNKMTACDGNIKMQLESGFLNSSGEGAYGLTGINLSEIDSSDQGCANKDFVIKAYYSNDDSPQGLIDSYTAITVRDYGTRFSINAITGVTLVSSNNSAFKLSFDTSHSLLESSRISSVTLESTDHVYSVGATGPGGGVIFYITKSPFSCGPTLLDLCNALEYSPGGSIAGQMNSRWAPQAEPSVLIGSSAQRTAIGTGFANSVAIVNQYTNVLGATQSTYQAGIARLYSAGSLSDWYMPSKDEIVELYNYAVSNNFYSTMAYFNSSSEVGASANWGLYFAQRNQVPTQTGSKLDNNPTWPIRAFMAPQTN
jgi:hypothetical protein